MHDDGINQLRCECGNHFSPFLDATPTLGADSNSPLMAMGEKHTFTGVPVISEVENPSSDVAAGTPTFSDYSESEAAFAELRSFGEDLGSLEIDSQVKPTPKVPIETETSLPSTPNSTPIVTTAQSKISSVEVGFPNCLITAGDQLSGYEIEAFLPPISIWCSTAVETEDPLKGAHEILSQRASHIGANGVVSVRWSFTPDGSRILLTGTPVKCRKQS